MLISYKLNRICFIFQLIRTEEDNDILQMLSLMPTTKAVTYRKLGRI